MQPEVVARRFASAVQALEAAGSDLRSGLFSAHMHLHAVRTEAVPDGPLRASFQRLLRRLQGREAGDARPRSVAAVLQSLDQSGVEILAAELRALAKAMAVG
jgi:hypothetical protein